MPKEARLDRNAAAARLRPISPIESVRARIIVALRLGTLKPGDRIHNANLVASGLEASEMTTRRALESLVADGALIRRRGAGGGTFVADDPTIPQDPAVETLFASGEDARELVDTRLMMESALAGFAAIHATPEQLHSIEDAVAAGSAAQDWTDFHAADKRFHAAVAEASGVASLEPYFSTMQRLYTYFIPYQITHLHGINDAHVRIYEAIKLGNVARAIEENRAHVASLYTDMFFAIGQSVDPSR